MKLTHEELAKYDEIINKINKHIKLSKCQYMNEMYIDITNSDSIDDILFNRHKVVKNEQWYCYIKTTKNIANEILHHFLQLGMKGGWNMDFNNNEDYYVYVYKISLDTVE
jgi:hypothetical protein